LFEPPIAPPPAKVLRPAGAKPPPDADRGEKKNYAQRLSNQLARVVADGPRPHYPDITPTAAGAGQEATVDVANGRKRLDVKVLDPTLGLVLCISIKTYSFQDYNTKTGKLGRWTKNIVRNDHELRGAAMVLHQRQPYSVLVAVLSTPLSTCDDGDRTQASDVGKSSFAHHVTTPAKRSGRGKRAVQGGPDRLWVDVAEQSPPRNGRPADAQTLSFEEFPEVAHHEVERRNRFAPSWSDPDSDE
jgi:hypothetical protein